MPEITSIGWCNATLNHGKPIPGYSAYRVIEDGRVMTNFSRGGRRRITTNRWHEKAPDVGDKGHLRVTLYPCDADIATQNRRAFVHVLVLEAFIGPCPDGMEGCHADGDPANNKLANLRWDTPQANWEDRRRHGRARNGEESPKAKLTERQVASIKRRLTKESRSALAREHGVTVQAISLIASGHNWAHVAPEAI